MNMKNTNKIVALLVASAGALLADASIGDEQKNDMIGAVASGGSKDDATGSPVSGSSESKWHSGQVALVVGDYTVNVEPRGFRFNIVDGAGNILAPMHPSSGLQLGGESVFLTEVDPDQEGVFTVATASGRTASIRVSAVDGVISVAVDPQQDSEQTISISLGGMPAAYGLGDNGGRSGCLNLVNSAKKSFRLGQNAGGFRWLTTFAIFPQNQLAGVVFDGNSPVVNLSSNSYTMSIKGNQTIRFHYMPGTMEEIYKNYRTLLDKNNFPNVKPKFTFFELGWESWAALGYQTSEHTVLESVADFQENGYPIRWAVTGSGFWEQGCTTTSFGKFGERFSDPQGFKEKLNQKKVKWLIGLRTNFVLPGGPHVTTKKKLDNNLKGRIYKGNPLSEVGLEEDFFVKDESGKLLVLSSPYFPNAPCYMLDGRNPEAAKWYAELYKKWGVDGIKEDTMMRIGSNVIDIFNDPIFRLAKDGALVMARCGSFSSSGTLLRINDTFEHDLAQRTPINYLQYAASGAPNVYSDTIGFRKMGKYSEYAVRHGWLMSLTAGLAVAEAPYAWSKEHQRLFKKPIDFHYKLGPYLYDAAIKSHQTGFPYTMTPMSIAYSNDTKTAQLTHYQWMAGESLLSAPLVKDYQSGKMEIYLPEGTWIDYDTGKEYKGLQLLKDFAMPVDKTPCFVGGKGVLVLRSSDDAPLRAHIYPVNQDFDTFVFTHPDGESTTTLKMKKGGKQGVHNSVTSKPVAFETDPKSGAISFDIEAGESYSFAF
jgi:alpha-glucosidase (family GH31 glycosyl hydrolase)